MININKNKCIGCAYCVPVCPKDAISCVGRAIIDEELCIECGACIPYCPNLAINFLPVKKENAVGEQEL